MLSMKHLKFISQNTLVVYMLYSFSFFLILGIFFLISTIAVFGYMAITYEKTEKQKEKDD